MRTMTTPLGWTNIALRFALTGFEIAVWQFGKAIAWSTSSTAAVSSRLQ